MNVTGRIIHRAVVTGATGFVGAHLARTLAAQNIEVTAPVRDPSKAGHLEIAGIRTVRGDITDPGSLPPIIDGADTVFHSAGVLGPAALDPAIYRAVNAEGTANMIEAARQSGSVRRFVHVSSVGVLGPLGPKETACEGTPPKPEDIYEITKLEGEEIALEAARSGFPAVIARPAWVYGPGDTRTLRLFKKIARGRFPLVGNAGNRQHPVYITDLVDGLIRCASISGIEGRVYHLAGPEILRVEKLCRIVAEETGKKLLPFKIPMNLFMIPALAIEKIYGLWGGNPPIDHRKVDFFRIHRAYSIRRAETELGWTPAVAFREGIRETIRWYRENGDLPSGKTTTRSKTA